MIPLPQFIALDESLFMRQDRGLYLRYQQAHAFTVFLMQWHEGTYREGFFDYVRDAYRGRIKRGSGRSLQDRLGQPYESLENQFLAFLQEGKRPDPAPGRASAKTTPGGFHPNRTQGGAGGRNGRPGRSDPDGTQTAVSEKPEIRLHFPSSRVVPVY